MFFSARTVPSGPRLAQVPGSLCDRRHLGRLRVPEFLSFWMVVLRLPTALVGLSAGFRVCVLAAVLVCKVLPGDLWGTCANPSGTGSGSGPRTPGSCVFRPGLLRCALLIVSQHPRAIQPSPVGADVPTCFSGLSAHTWSTWLFFFLARGAF
jgi:hypothetical protein